MMRNLVASALVAAGIVACSSVDEPACQIDGTYSVTGTVESGNCPVSGDPVTDTFTTLSDGRVQLQIQGLPGLIPVGTVSGCTWTAANRVTILDATGPEKEGTLQYSYTFDRAGLSGIVSQSLPPAKSLPGGCRGTVRVMGTRR